MKKLIYTVDDEKDILDIIELNLKDEGYDVISFSSAEEAEKRLSRKKPDLIILDIMMQGMDGYEFCRKIRSDEKHKKIPVIFLSAKSEEFDKVLGLELGGDDYITKPFSIKELKSRVKAVLRRSKPEEKMDISDIIKYRGVVLNPQNYSLIVDDNEKFLTKTEFNMLYLFMKNPGRLFTRDNIIDSIRGEDVYVLDRTIDVHVMNLRKKLGRYKNIIKTFSGVGYGFKELKDESKED